MNNNFRRLRLDMTGRLHWPGAVCHPAGSRRKNVPPGHRSRLSVTLTGRRLLPIRSAASPPSARPPPPPSAPSSDRLAQPADAGGGGGRRQDTPVMASARRKTEALTLGLKNRPHKIDESSIFAPKGAPFIFRQVLKKITAIERILRKILTKDMRGGQNLPPPFQCALRVLKHSRRCDDEMKPLNTLHKNRTSHCVRRASVTPGTLTADRSI